jgi:hypothetical protein
MKRITAKSVLLTKVKTIWFLFALIPIMLATLLVAVSLLVLGTPLIVYAWIRGKHLKNPWRNSLIPPSSRRERKIRGAEEHLCRSFPANPGSASDSSTMASRLSETTCAFKRKPQC